jgi:hypothetical protein
VSPLAIQLLASSSAYFDGLLAVTDVIKAFYNFAKHYIGFFLNYVRFMDRVVMCATSSWHHPHHHSSAHTRATAR